MEEMARPNPRSSAKLISGLSRHVFVCQRGVRRVADLIEKPFLNNEYDVKKWKQHRLNPKTTDENAINWIFLVDTLNFSFWSRRESSKCHISFDGQHYTGYWALCAAVNRALQNGIPICRPEYYADMTVERLSDVLRPDSGDDMPLIEDRCRVLRETGKILLEKFEGRFVNVLLQSDGSMKKLLELIVDNFPSYRDEAFYRGHRVCFYKRAQILIGDIWACCEGKGLGSFRDIDAVTVFADYRIPQLLLHLGALKYSEELMEELTEQKELESGSEKEVEIRGCTIWAVEMVMEEMSKRMVGRDDLIINSVLVDYYLWDYRRSHVEETQEAPFHRTRCIYY